MKLQVLNGSLGKVLAAVAIAFMLSSAAPAQGGRTVRQAGQILDELGPKVAAFLSKHPYLPYQVFVYTSKGRRELAPVQTAPSPIPTPGTPTGTPGKSEQWLQLQKIIQDSEQRQR
jgi:hypothetical protein